MMLLQLIVLYIVVFAVLIVILRFLFYRQLNDALARLKTLHNENLVKEETLKKELIRAKQEHDSIVEEAKHEAERLRLEARGIAEKTRDSIIAQAKDEARRILEEAEKEKIKMRSEIALELKHKSISAAKEIINRIFSQKAMECLHHQLIDELIDEMASIDKNAITARDANSIEVITALPLDDGQKERLRDMFCAKLETEVSLVNNVNQSIIAGIMVRIGGFVIDGSLENKLAKSAEMIRVDGGR